MRGRPMRACEAMQIIEIENRSDASPCVLFLCGRSSITSLCARPNSTIFHVLLQQSCSPITRRYPQLTSHQPPPCTLHIQLSNSLSKQSSQPTHQINQPIQQSNRTTNQRRQTRRSRVRSEAVMVRHSAASPGWPSSGRAAPQDLNRAMATPDSTTPAMAPIEKRHSVSRTRMSRGSCWRCWGVFGVWLVEHGILGRGAGRPIPPTHIHTRTGRDGPWARDPVPFASSGP